MRVLHQIEHGLDRESLAIDSEAQARDRLVEKPVPGADTVIDFSMKQIVRAVVELIGLALTIASLRFTVDGETLAIEPVLNLNAGPA